jgi:tetratricopeptide (TPR) repeat protein
MLLAAIGLLSASEVSLAQPATSGLANLVEQLAASPGDDALRRRVIETARDTRPSPSIPDAARRSFVQGVAIAQAATDPSGQQLAIDRFNDALRLAPWWGDAYYNRGVAQDLAGQYDAAKTSIQFYLLTRPSAQDAQQAQDRIYAIEGRQALAARNTTPANGSTSRVSVDSNSLIVPGRSFGPITIGMTVDELYAVAGSPQRVIEGVPHGYDTNVYAQYTVLVRNARVSSVTTADGRAAYRTAEGIAIGSIRRELLAASGEPCATRTVPADPRGVWYVFSPGLTVRVLEDRVASIAVTELQPECQR